MPGRRWPLRRSRRRGRRREQRTRSAGTADISGSKTGSASSSADTVGHKSTHVTETVYRHVIVPAIRGGATVVDTIFEAEEIPDRGTGHSRNTEIA